MKSVQLFASQNWFYIILPALFLVDFKISFDLPWLHHPRLSEQAILFDWCVFVPVLFLICYRGKFCRALMMRMLAMMCGGIWVAGKLVPHTAQFILPDLIKVRPLGLSVLAIFETLASIALLRVLFGASSDEADLESHGVPPLLSRLMLYEARLWHRVIKLLKGHQ